LRAVLDPNVLISALLSPAGTPARLLAAWLGGAFELVVSPALLAELGRALRYPKIRDRVTASEARELVALLRRHATVVDDPSSPPPVRSADPGDDYLLALAAISRAVLVSGDRHLLELGAGFPVDASAGFLRRLGS
jgi:putative PIN family toxin of toxin-antitoxin system